MDPLSDQTISQHIEEYSKAQDKALKELREAKYLSDEKPLKQKVQATSAVVASLVRLRSVKRTETERQT